MNIYDYFNNEKLINIYIKEIPIKYIFYIKNMESEIICNLFFYKNKIDKYGNKIFFELYIDKTSIYYKKKLNRKLLKNLIYKYLEKKICKNFTINDIKKKNNK